MNEYNKVKEDVEFIMDSLKAEILIHECRAKENDYNNNYLNDILEVKHRLSEMVGFLRETKSRIKEIKKQTKKEESVYTEETKLIAVVDMYNQIVPIEAYAVAGDGIVDNEGNFYSAGFDENGEIFADSVDFDNRVISVETGCFISYKETLRTGNERVHFYKLGKNYKELLIENNIIEG
jgi:hypothetical protein